MSDNQPIRALSLSGGGGRGAFHAGVYEYLMSENKENVDAAHAGPWKPDIVVGTSIGAVNGAAIAQGMEAGDLAGVWRHLEEQDIQGIPPRMRGMARRIVQRRPIRTTTELAKAVEQAVGRRANLKTHPATRTFQALRIAVNQELDSLAAALPQAHGLLGFGSRLVVLSYHSLEDRIVKEYIRRESRDCICPPGLPECRCGHRATLRPITRGALKPSLAEVAENPRARSARLRAAERIIERAA